MLGRLIARELRSPTSVMGCLFLAPLWNRRNAALNDATLDALSLAPGDRVLEIGFGGGYLLGRILGRLAGGLAAGIDHSPAMVRYVRRRYRTHIRAGALRLHRGAADYLPFEDRSFTKVCSVNSIFYWDDAPRVLSEVWRVLQPGAAFILCFTDHKALENKSFSGEITRYDVDQVQRMLEHPGFHVRDRVRGADTHRAFWCVTATA
jgi:arsenite methyltransferase